MTNKEYVDYPKNKQEWWDIVYKFKEELLYLIDMYHPGSCNTFDYHITANVAEQVCETIRKQIRNDCVVDVFNVAKQCIENKNDNFLTILDQTWFGMPESYTVRSEPGFDVLCDLCSESYVLKEE